MRSGVLLIDKPAGITSAGVVARVKRMLHADRVGHAGTLDPDATGLLVVLLNGATRAASYAADGWKVYSGMMRLGVTTSTDDMSGEILRRCAEVPLFEVVQEAVERFTGLIEQVPPRVSAIKVNGKRAHKLHRRGAEFELAARKVEVRRFEVLRSGDPEVISYTVECSPGTYIRSLARDLGEVLGCGGAVDSIRRIRSGHFDVDSAQSLEDVEWSRVQDWGVLLPEVPRLEVNVETARSLLNGQLSGLARAWEYWQRSKRREEGDLVVFLAQGSPDSLGILRIRDGSSFEFETNINTKNYCQNC